MTDAARHSLADEISAAFTGEVPAMSKPERIVELAQAQWIGRQESRRDGALILFRDPVTGSVCALPEEGLTVAGVLAKLESKRKEFERRKP
jgi:hypothetical protein